MLQFRLASINDAYIYYNWANDSEVREQSFTSDKIDFNDHEKWFKTKLNDKTCYMFIFQNEENENIGQVRIQEQDGKNAIIGISIDKFFRGYGYAKEMLINACEFYFKSNVSVIIHAYIKKNNLSSQSAFKKAGFQNSGTVYFEGYESVHYILKK